MYSLSMLALRIEAAMLFENIEVDYQLHFAWKHGGRYCQGHYLAQPEFDLASSDTLSLNLEKKVDAYIQHEKSLVEQ